MPNCGSVNQIEPSDFTTTSFGELSRLPSYLSAITVIEPSISVRVTQRVRCSQVTRRPCRSRVLPLALLDGLRNTLVAPLSSSQRSMRLLGMSLQITQPMSPNQTGPSPHSVPLARRSTCVSITRYLSKRLSSDIMEGSGYRVLGVQSGMAFLENIFLLSA